MALKLNPFLCLVPPFIYMKVSWSLSCHPPFCVCQPPPLLGGGSIWHRIKVRCSIIFVTIKPHTLSIFVTNIVIFCNCIAKMNYCPNKYSVPAWLEVCFVHHQKDFQRGQELWKHHHDFLVVLSRAVSFLWNKDANSFQHFTSEGSGSTPKTPLCAKHVLYWPELWPLCCVMKRPDPCSLQAMAFHIASPWDQGFEPGTFCRGLGLRENPQELPHQLVCCWVGLEATSPWCYWYYSNNGL